MTRIADADRGTPESGVSGHLAAAVYEQLPYGLVVVDEQGSVLSANPAAIEMGWQFECGAGPPTSLPRGVRVLHARTVLPARLPHQASCRLMAAVAAGDQDRLAAGEPR